MLIKRLVIKESFPTERVIRDIKFNLKGLNLIVDDGNKRGNGVGKTTFLRLIDIAFGAKDRKALYVDPETSSVNKKLKEYIEQSKVFIELSIIDEITSKEDLLMIELFQKGIRSINGEKYNYNEYNSQLNSIIFDNKEKNPSFRNLIGKFVRINMNGDNNKFLHFNDDHCTPAGYQNIYNYLFKFKNTDIENIILDLRETIRNFENQFKMVKQTLQYDGLNQIDAKIDVILGKVKELESKQATYINEKIVLDENKIMENRKDYSLLTRECEKLIFDIKILEENIQRESVENQQLDMESLKEFYDDTKFHLSNLSKKFDELVEFNKQLNKNQLNTFNKLLQLKKERLSEIDKRKEIFYKNNRDYMFLIETGSLEEYLNLQENLNSYQTGLGECYSARDIYTDYTNKILDAKSMLDEQIEKNKVNKVEERLKEFNEIFTNYSKQTVNAEYFLYYNESGFPLSISNVDGSFSTGTRKSAIISFDLAYLQYSRKLNIKCPKFVIHDVLENIHQNDFYQTIELIKKQNFQYIAAILKQSIIMHDNINENTDVLLTLSEDEKLFLV